MDGICHNQTFPPPSTGATSPFLWIPQPTYRRTSEILSTCLSTTIICVWSSIHRDIPVENVPMLRKLRQDAFLVMAALLFPELLLFHACNQLATAWPLVRKASKKLKGVPLLEDQHNDEESSSLINRQTKKHSRRHRFTLVHGFYVVMGGYAFSVLDEDEKIAEPRFLPGNKTRARITSRGMLFLLEHDQFLIPDLSMKSITHRSKSNGLGKALVLVQLAWFCTNCVSRLGQHLPLSLLEVSTAARVLFTLASYAVWWYKPLNIDDPTLISGERAREALALLRIIGADSHSVLEAVNNGTERQIGINQLELGLKAAERYGVSSDVRRIDRSNSGPFVTFDPPLSLLHLLGGWESVKDYVGVFYAFVFFQFIHGLIHLLGVVTQFPTLIERELWAYAAMIIMAAGFCYFAVAAWIGVLFSCFGQCASSWVVSGLGFIYYYLGILFAFLYTCSALYLFLESVRQIFYLPPQAYVVASWSYYFPHLS